MYTEPRGWEMNLRQRRLNRASCYGKNTACDDVKELLVGADVNMTAQPMRPPSDTVPTESPMLLWIL